MPDAPIVERLRAELAQGAADLPMLGQDATRALLLASKSDLDTAQVVSVAEKYPPFAARLLAVANSALYYRGGSPIVGLAMAAARLGGEAARDALYHTVYGTALFNVPAYREEVGTIWRHSVLTSRLARCLCEQLRIDSDAAFIAALLHDVGRARCLKIAARLRLPYDAALATAVDELHTFAGAQLADAWDLPPEVVLTCAQHHASSTEGIVKIVTATDVLAHHTEERATDADVAHALGELGMSNGPELIALAGEVAESD